MCPQYTTKRPPGTWVKNEEGVYAVHAGTPLSFAGVFPEEVDCLTAAPARSS